MYICMYVCMYLCTYVRTYVCIYIYIYIYVYMYIYIYIYIYIRGIYMITTIIIIPIIISTDYTSAACSRHLVRGASSGARRVSFREGGDSEGAPRGRKPPRRVQRGGFGEVSVGSEGGRRCAGETVGSGMFNEHPCRSKQGPSARSDVMPILFMLRLILGAFVPDG